MSTKKLFFSHFIQNPHGCLLSVVVITNLVIQMARNLTVVNRQIFLDWSSVASQVIMQEIQKFMGSLKLHNNSNKIM